MKKASDIINLIQNKPQFSKLSYYLCINKVQSLFSKPLQNMVKFAYIKNNTLFFVLNHPGAKQEFDNNIDTIKSALKFVKPQECQDTKFDDIKAFVTHTPTKIVEFKPKKIQRYKERAKGEFDISVDDENIKKIFQEIKDIIKNETSRDN